MAFLERGGGLRTRSVEGGSRGLGGAGTEVEDDIDPRMRKVGVLLALTALAACESQSAASQDVATVRAAGDAMEESGSFAVARLPD